MIRIRLRIWGSRLNPASVFSHRPTGLAQSLDAALQARVPDRNPDSPPFSTLGGILAEVTRRIRNLWLRPRSRNPPDVACAGLA